MILPTASTLAAGINNNQRAADIYNTVRRSSVMRLVMYLAADSIALFRTLVIAHCVLIPMTCGSCSCSEHIINLAIGASRPPVFDYELWNDITPVSIEYIVICILDVALTNTYIIDLQYCE